MPTRNSILLTLVPCGETSWDVEKRLQGAADLPLSDHGRRAIDVMLDRLHGIEIGPIHHPPDEAATETAKIIAGVTGGRARASAGLADPELGLLEGMTEQMFAERYPKRFKQWQEDPVTLSPPEGEDLAEARSRILRDVARILRKSKSDRLCIVLRTIGRGCLRCWLADRPQKELRTLLQDPPKVERYVLTGPMIDWLEEAATPLASRTSATR